MFFSFITKTIIHHIYILSNGCNPLYHFAPLEYLIFIWDFGNGGRAIIFDGVIYFFKLMPYLRDLDGDPQKYFKTYLHAYSSNDFFFDPTAVCVSLFILVAARFIFEMRYTKLFGIFMQIAITMVYGIAKVLVLLELVHVIYTFAFFAV